MGPEEVGAVFRALLNSVKRNLGSKPKGPGWGHGVSKQRRCLIIDEHPTVRLGVRRLLAGRYEVEEAADGSEALEVITSLGEFDVAVVELGTPANADRPSGIAAIRSLRRARPGIGI